jgi:hypothetical protein
MILMHLPVSMPVLKLLACSPVKAADAARRVLVVSAARGQDGVDASSNSNRRSFALIPAPTPPAETNAGALSSTAPLNARFPEGLSVCDSIDLRKCTELVHEIEICGEKTLLGNIIDVEADEPLEK